MLSADDAASLGLSKQDAETFPRRIYGLTEFIRGVVRKCLWIPDEKLPKALQIASIQTRMDDVREMRLKIATVCDKLETSDRCSNPLGWNTFPVPMLTEKNRADLTRCAEDILLARERHFPATIADLYDPEHVPADLRAAHERNDVALERVYIGCRFKNDTERLEKQFELYTRMTAGNAGAAPKAKKRSLQTATDEFMGSA